jgi:RES domain-containing protein
MRVWRVTRRAHAAPDGEGARLYGGRWNLPNTAVVYASASLSLAVLEYLVHVDRDLAPSDLVSIAATIPSAFRLRR